MIKTTNDQKYFPFLWGLKFSMTQKKCKKCQLKEVPGERRASQGMYTPKFTCKYNFEKESCFGNIE